MIFNLPETIDASLFTTLPAHFRVAETSTWSLANMGGRAIDSFLEGPSFDRNGQLHVVDIPNGRIFRISEDGGWELFAQYDGWPNGLKIHRDGDFYVADYRRGIVRIDPTTREPEFLLETRDSEGFKGCNDLFFTSDGALYFTDQGQTGLHDPTGRVFRMDAEGRLAMLVATVPSPNGIVANLAQDQIFVAATRGNAIWRLPLLKEGQVSKVGLFIQLSGGIAGPDGLALDAEGGVLVCQVGLGVLRYDALGLLTHVVRSPAGVLWTNLAFGTGDHHRLFLVDSVGANIHTATMPVPGTVLFSHLLT
ncbi:SMP-30/gluconolactonase/LRE family protein [Variovorax sp. J31P207]|uniref:SMP-30/gluconolactonase/LRE family protein n=1 Tax=Variovorax sp. J31P207 TaxID=3053510 RepID=UPI0025777AA3|nr:SMP-30/gluconolactonase/LRE family protein [Variovorax sp. J31P207]MDM0072124.1 SMP-30/gluconolactonase/LRE family protein [Variovorax sp. J31P207]